MKQSTDGKCRMCCKADKQIKHVVAGFTTLAPCEYTNKHNKVAGYTHRKICKHMGLHVTDRYCGCVPESVINVIYTAIMWDVPVITVRTILAN